MMMKIVYNILCTQIILYTKEIEMATVFQTTSEVHQHFSKIAKQVRENEDIVVITRNGKPFLALLPAEEINPDFDYIQAMTREVNNQWSKFVKEAVEGKTVYITYKKEMCLQLIAITEEDLHDIIIAYSKDIQAKYSETLQLDNVRQLKSARDLLNERKKKRAENNTQN